MKSTRFTYVPIDRLRTTELQARLQLYLDLRHCNMMEELFVTNWLTQYIFCSPSYIKLDLSRSCSTVFMLVSAYEALGVGWDVISIKPERGSLWYDIKWCVEIPGGNKTVVCIASTKLISPWVIIRRARMQTPVWRHMNLRQVCKLSLVSVWLSNTELQGPSANYISSLLSRACSC